MKPYYEKDGITIYYGDCREVLPTLEPVDCIVTSPPYNQLGTRIPDKQSGMWAQSNGGSGFPRAIKERGYIWNQDQVGFGTIWRVAREQQQQGKSHPVGFPVKIPSRCIAASTNPDAIVLDPFMGSGTTLRAAKDLGRKAIGIEIHEPYCEIAARRLEQGVLNFEPNKTDLERS